MIIPIEEINTETLATLIKEFVLREGTEYGLNDVSLENKIVQVHSQLKKKQVFIVYSELHETVNIVPAEHIQHSVKAES